MNTQNVWIKRSEREPGMKDFPVLGGHYDNDGKWVQYTIWAGLLQSEPCTHWRSMKCDPPPRELTQRERDDGLAQVVLENWIEAEGGSKTLALLAIYAERREVAKLMEEIHGRVAWEHGAMWNDGLVKLRARLGEQGAK